MDLGRASIAGIDPASGAFPIFGFG
jgi:hypothetical protein